jgi:hypothetical protein
MLANFQASDLEEQTANDGLQFGPIIAGNKNNGLFYHTKFLYNNFQMLVP